MSIAHEVSGLGSTRVVRFSVPKGSGDDGTGTVATGPENAEVQGRFEPLGAAGAVGNGRGGDSGGVGAAISALPAALRGRRAPRAAGQAPGQGLGQAGAGRRDRMDARRVPDRISRLEGQAFSRASYGAGRGSLGRQLEPNAGA